MPTLFAATTSAVAAGLGRLPARPDVVLVQGDTATALAGAHVAFLEGIPVGHVEAGLRTENPRTPFPEEMNRRMISQLATLHFAPTTLAAYNLDLEGIRKYIYVTGNTGIDELRHVETELTLAQKQLADCSRVLITFHRRENRALTLPHVLAAADTLRRHGIEVVWPGHPGVDATKEHPLTHKEMVAELYAAHLVATDSGGLIEEAIALGKRTVILRLETERPEAITHGDARLITRRELPRLADVITAALRRPQRPPSDVFGDGHAAQRIVYLLAQFHQRKAGRDREDAPRTTMQRQLRGTSS